MTTKRRSLNASQAAKKLGVSVKALRVYEQRGLLSPTRTDAGWRLYQTNDMTTAGEIVALRSLGLSLNEVQRVLSGEVDTLDAALAVHEARMQHQIQNLKGTIKKVRSLRYDIATGEHSTSSDLIRLMKPIALPVVASFKLPWPWGGETFDVERPQRLNFIVGPLGSGKTRFGRQLAEALPDADFFGIERLANGCAEPRAQIAREPVLNARVDRALSWLVDEGADASDALIALLVGLEADTQAALVVDLIEQDLGATTQEALGAYLRGVGRNQRPLFVMTRSSSILDLNEIRPDDRIIFCPPNHKPPMYVAPFKNAPGYEAVSLCLATPEVRKRTERVIAIRVPATA